MSSNSEVARYPTERLAELLSLFLAKVACRYYDKPNNPPDETCIEENLIAPLRWMLCGMDPSGLLNDDGVQEHRLQAKSCGKKFIHEEITYSCKDCQTDIISHLCIECYEHSEHKTHNFRLVASDGGEYCDCGNPDAWKSFIYCDIHKPKYQGGQEVDPVKALHTDLADRARPFLFTLLWYCMDMLCLEESSSLPTLLQTTSMHSTTTYFLFIYKNENISDEEVKFVLTSVLKLRYTDAESVVKKLDIEGRSVCKVGNHNICQSCRNQMSDDIESKTVVFHSAMAAHQACAIHCLLFLTKLSEDQEAFRRLISEAMVKVRPTSGNNIVDSVFLNDSKMWIAARLGWHGLINSSIMRDVKCKPQLAVSLTNKYSHLMKQFVEDPLDEKLSVCHINPQLFPIPSIGHMLVRTHGVLLKIVSTLSEAVSPCKDPETKHSMLTLADYDHPRVYHIIADLMSILKKQPEDLSDIREPVLEAFSKMIDVFSMAQGADPVIRKRGEHVVKGRIWNEHCNLFISTTRPLEYFIMWCTSDKAILTEAVRLTLKKYEEIAGRNKLTFTTHDLMIGHFEKGIDVIDFDIGQETVSIHQPLTRILAGLLAGANAHNLTFIELLQIQPTDTHSPIFIMEMSIRVLVLASQVRARMWERNGHFVRKQVHNYHFLPDMTYDKDILILQEMAAIMDPTVFLYSIICKYRLHNWITSHDKDTIIDRGEPSIDAFDYFQREAEEFFFLLINIFCERYVVGVGEGVTETDPLERNLIHKLFISRLFHRDTLNSQRDILNSHCDILNYLNWTDDKEDDINQLLKKVADFKNGVFELKQEYEECHNPFFSHYSKIERSKAEVQCYNIKSSSSSTKDAPLAKLPPFCQPFKNIVHLTTSPVLHRMFKCIFKPSTSELVSDRLLHEALYLFGVMLREEDPTKPSSLANCSVAGGFLDDLEALPCEHMENCKPLISYIVQKLKFHRDAKGCNLTPSAAANTITPSGRDEEKKSQEDERRKMAKRRAAEMAKERAAAMMQRMQQTFMKSEMDEESDTDTSDTGLDEPMENNTAISCAVGPAALIDSTPVFREESCMLCGTSTGSEDVSLQAVCVQRSCVLKHTSPVNTRELDTRTLVSELLKANADHTLGIYTGGCGHHVHQRCWKEFIDTKKKAKNEDNRSLWRNKPSVKWVSGEFLCQLCQNFSSTLLPLLPPISSSLPSQPEHPRKDIGFSGWRELVNIAVDLATSNNSIEEPHALWERLSEIFVNLSRPSSYQHERKGEFSEDDKISHFCQHVYKVAFRKDLNDSDSIELSAALWNNCAYTISCLEMSAGRQNKLLISSLSPRELDYVQSLVAICFENRLGPSASLLGSTVKDLLSMFQIENTTLSTSPSILEIDAFSLMVYLFFSVTSLFCALVSSTGRLSGSSVLPALVGVTALQSVRIAVVARLVQFILTTTPAMDTSNSTSSGSEGGENLHRLWTVFRQTAGISDDFPPDTKSLVDGARKYLRSLILSSVLFFQSLTGIKFNSSSPDDEDLVFAEMCTFLNIPLSLHTLFEEPTNSHEYTLNKLALGWCSHSKIRELDEAAALPPILKQPRPFISLPQSYTDLISRLSKFKCPNEVVERKKRKDEGAFLCLLCDSMICAKSYCCEHSVPGTSHQVGALTRHAQSCGDGLSISLWIRDGCIILLDATDINHVKGCSLTPPYLDVYWQSDPGLRRGYPLKLRDDKYEELKLLWFQHKLPEKITQEMENVDRPAMMRLNWHIM